MNLLCPVCFLNYRTEQLVQESIDTYKCLKCTNSYHVNDLPAAYTSIQQTYTNQLSILGDRERSNKEMSVAEHKAIDNNKTDLSQRLLKISDLLTYSYTLYKEPPIEM